VIPPDVEFPVVMSGLGILARNVPLDETTLRDVYTHLLPFSGTFNWTGASISNPNDHGLAVLAAKLGDFAASEKHFATAVALCEQSGATPFQATACLDWANLLAERDETDAARVQAQAAFELGDPLGMTGPAGVAPLAKALLEQLGS
jgi:hypothetical protein